MNSQISLNLEESILTSYFAKHSDVGQMTFFILLDFFWLRFILITMMIKRYML